MVIDSGSTKNMVSCEMVNKLGLKKIPHECPYKISWLTDDQSLLVNEKAIVDFQIGGYHDSVVCDVLPMDCCHLLLGRPWKYDKRELYDGRENTYTIVKDGYYFVLNRLIEDIKGKEQVIMCGRKEPINVMKENFFLMLLPILGLIM